MNVLSNLLRYLCHLHAKFRPLHCMFDVYLRMILYSLNIARSWHNKVTTVDREIFVGKIFRRLNFRLV